MHDKTEPNFTLTLIGTKTLFLHCTENSQKIIPRNETARPCSQFLHSYICDRFIYSQDRSAYFAVLSLQTDHWNILIAHRYMNVINIETRPRNFLSGNICFEFSEQCICRELDGKTVLPKEGSDRRFLLASFTICSWYREN
jgi:hypothetical protein